MRIGEFKKGRRMPISQSFTVSNRECESISNTQSVSITDKDAGSHDDRFKKHRPDGRGCCMWNSGMVEDNSYSRRIRGLGQRDGFQLFLVLGRL
jgi:hypothetical protein